MRKNVKIGIFYKYIKNLSVIFTYRSVRILNADPDPAIQTKCGSMRGCGSENLILALTYLWNIRKEYAKKTPKGLIKQEKGYNAF